MKTSKVFQVSKKKIRPDAVFRNLIIVTARDLFLRGGFVRVTMDEIAGTLGISKATLYKQFSSKEDVLAAAMETVKKDILAGFEGIIADDKMDFLEKLARLMAFMGNWLSRIGQFLAKDLRRSAPGVWKDIELFRREKILKNFSVLFEGGVREGVFKADIDRGLVLQIYLVLIQNFLNPETLLGSSSSAPEIFETLFKVFFEGILTDGARMALADRKASFYMKNKEVV